MTMKKTILTIVLCICTLVLLILPAAAAKDITVLLDNSKVKFDVQPQIIDNRTMVPIRAIFEAMGAAVTWDGKTSTATATIDDYVVKCTVGSKKINVNGSLWDMDTAPVIIGGRTLMPARFAAEAFGASVGWDANSRTVTITSLWNHTFYQGTPCTTAHTYNAVGLCSKCNFRAEQKLIDVTDYFCYIGSAGAEQRTAPFALAKAEGYYKPGEQVKVIAEVKNYYGGVWYMVAKDTSRWLIYSGDIAPSYYLKDFTPTYTHNGPFYYEAQIKDNLGNAHVHSVGVSSSSSYQTYDLGGKYTRLTGAYFMSYDQKDFNTSNTPLLIYGDDKLLYREEMQGEMLPVIFSVDVTGVKTLKIEIRDGSSGPHAQLADCRLWWASTSDKTEVHTINSRLTTDVPSPIWLKNLEPYFAYYASGLFYAPSVKDNVGNTHSYAFGTNNGRNYNTYLVNRNYSTLTGTLFMTEEAKDYNHRINFYVYGDDKLLYSTDIQGGDKPINISVDITGVVSLRIEMNEGMTGPHAYFGDAALYK